LLGAEPLWLGISRELLVLQAKPVGEAPICSIAKARFQAKLLRLLGFNSVGAEMKSLRPSLVSSLPKLIVKPLAGCLIFLCAVAISLCAQEGGPPPGGNQDADVPTSGKQEPGLSAGGKWKEFRSEDKMTAAQKVRFELEADTLLPDSDAKAKVILFCVNGKLELGDFRPNLRIGPPNWASFWGRPQMGVRVRVDSSSSRHHWNWVQGRFLAMDKDTVRQLIGSQIFKVEFETPRGRQIAEFSPAGLDLALVRKDCNLKPQKP
jgi:hypothetical protein